MAEDGAKAAGVEASSEAGADDGIGEELVADAEAGREAEVVRLDSEVAGDAADAGDGNVPGGGIEAADATGLGGDLGQVVLPAQAVSNGELGGGAPGVLAEEEETSLADAGVEAGGGEVAVEVRRLAE